MTAFTWLNDLARWLAAWVPRWTLIPPTHRAILFGPRGGATARGPGLVFWWPIAQKIERVPVVKQPMEMCARLLPVQGGGDCLIPRAAVCGLVVEFTVVDPLLAALATTNLRAIVDNRIQARFGQEWSSSDLPAEIAERTLRGVAPGLLAEFGARIDVLKVGNIGPAIPFKQVADWSHQGEKEGGE